MPSAPAIIVSEEPDDTPRVEPAVLSVETAPGTSYPPPPPNLNSASPQANGGPKSKPPQPPPRDPSYSRRPSIRIAALEAEGEGELSSEEEEEDESGHVSRDSSGRLSKGGSPTGSERLDDSTRYVKGGGILASMKDVSVAPTEFAEGCKLLQACALGDRTRVEALLRINKGHINFRD